MFWMRNKKKNNSNTHSYLEAWLKYYDVIVQYLYDWKYKIQCDVLVFSETFVHVFQEDLKNSVKMFC